MNIKGKNIRELKEVIHYETSVLTKMPANPKAGVMNVVKSLTGVELKTLVNEFTDHLATIFFE